MARRKDTKIHQPNGLVRFAESLGGPGHYRQIQQKLSQSQERSWRGDRGGEGIYVHNLGACSMSSKEDEFVSSIYIFFNYFFIYVLINIVFRLKQMRVILLIISKL